MNDDDDRALPNDTALGLLRKLEDGDYVNDVGAKVQGLLRKMRTVSSKRGRVTGSFTIKVKIAMGKDGHALITPMPVEIKEPKDPARTESVVYIDEDGDINGKPVEKQMTFKVIENKAKDPAAPAVKAT